MKWLDKCFLVLVYGLSFQANVSVSQTDYLVLPDYDMENPQTLVTNPPSVYLQFPGMSTEVYVNWIYNGLDTSFINNIIYFRTCTQCYIKVENVGKLSNSIYCLNQLPSEYRDVNNHSCVFGCLYFLLFDADYKNETWKIVSSTSSIISYRSQSKNLHITACAMNYNQNITMRLRLTSMEKIENFTPDSKVSEFTLTSPFFPSPYVKNGELYTFKLQANPQYKIIVVTFDDWWLSYNSYVQESSKPELITGNLARPYFTSYGRNVTISFFTGESSVGSSNFLGFKAVAKFYNVYQALPTVNIDCDRVMSSDGGIISLSSPDNRYQDCIWVIRKMADYNGVYLKIINYDKVNSIYDTSEYNLRIIKGITSEGNVILTAKKSDPQVNNSIHYSEFGFYIRIKGDFLSRDSIMLAYALYKFDCYSFDSLFKCGSDLCISDSLKCDGYDHCGDNSDEATSLCGHDTTYTSHSSPINISIIIPLVVCAFLIIVMCILIIFIRRCRRINNAAQQRRPPGVSEPQSRGRRHRRHNRDVQMSVTLSSGDHPPSYDEVLQSTPIGYLNMAFAWSQHGNVLTQPPSYDEAVSPSAPPQNGSIIITATANNGVCHGETNATPHHQNSSTVLTTIISSSLDPRAEVSSSSSSEDPADHYSQLDISSSSDSSTENERLQIADNCNPHHSRSVTNLNKVGKDSDTAVTSHSGPKYASDSEGAQVMLKSPSFEKLNTEIREGVINPDNIRRTDQPKGTKNLDVDKNKKNGNESRDRHMVVRDDQNLHTSERQRQGRRDGGDHYSSRNDDLGVGDRRQGKERNVYQKLKWKHSDQRIGGEGAQIRGHGDQWKPGNEGLHNQSPRVTDSSRSQSCVDLSWGVGSRRLPDASMAGLRDEDKRFSYAGAGDVSLTRGSLDPFYNGKGLTREKHIEHLDKYASQSYDNLSMVRGHDNATVNGQEECVRSRQSHSSDHSGYFPRSKRDKSDLHRSDGQYSVLAPVKENLSDDVHETVERSHDTSKLKHSRDGGRNDKFQENTLEDKWSQVPNYRTPSQSGTGISQAQANVAQKASSHETRGLNAVHLPSGQNSVRSPGGIIVNSNPENLYVDNQRQLSNSLDSRRHQEPQYSNQNIDTLSSHKNPHSSRNITVSSDGVIHSQKPSDLRRNSKDSDVFPDYKNIPQSDQDREIIITKPKPSLRTQFQTSQQPDREASASQSQFQTSQRSDRDALKAMSKSSGQSHFQDSHQTDTPAGVSHFQTSQKPTPTPRQGIKKRQDTDAKRPNSIPSGDSKQWPDQISYGEPMPHSLHSATRHPNQMLPNTPSAQQMNLSGSPRPDSQQTWESHDISRRLTHGQRGRDDGRPAHPNEQTSSMGQIHVQTTSDDVFV